MPLPTLYADENISQSVVNHLLMMGYDIVTVAERGKAGQKYPDDLVLQDAAAMGRVLVTHNRKDFRRLHMEGADHAGIVLCTQDHDARRLAARINAALSNKATMAREVINVYRPVK